jgi:hypothetical protein
MQPSSPETAIDRPPSATLASHGPLPPGLLHQSARRLKRAARYFPRASTHRPSFQ